MCVCVFFLVHLDDHTLLHAYAYTRNFRCFPSISHFFPFAIPLQDRSIHLTYSYPYTNLHRNEPTVFRGSVCEYVCVCVSAYACARVCPSHKMNDECYFVITFNIFSESKINQTFPYHSSAVGPAKRSIMKWLCC